MEDDRTTDEYHLEAWDEELTNWMGTSRVLATSGNVFIASVYIAFLAVCLGIGLLVIAIDAGF